MYLTINSQFRPFTYDELAKPLQDYTEAYNKVEEQYATLAQQTEAWKNIATQENSPKAYAMYKRYSDELNAVIDDFSRGMTIQNRSKLTGLKSRYASEITPISIAYDAYQKANAYRDTVKEEDDSAIFNVDRYYSLDDFLNGQMADNNYISGRKIQADIASQILSECYGQYNNLVAQGHSKEAAANIVTKGKWVDSNDIYSNVYANTGVTSASSAEKLKNYTDRGIAQGLAAFSTGIEETLYKDASGNLGSTSVAALRWQQDQEDEIALQLYEAFGLPTYDEVKKSTTRTTDPDTEYESTSTETTTSEMAISNSRKISNPDVQFGIALINEGVFRREVIDLYHRYKEAKSDETTEATSFEGYVEEQLEDW